MNSSLFPPTLGELRVAMLFVDFADVRGDGDLRAVYEAFVPQAVEWYRSVSYGRLRLAVTPLFRRLALPGTAGEYGPGGGRGAEAGLRAALEQSIAAADADLDFGGVHAVYLVLPYGAVDTIGASGVLILEQPVRADGADLRTFAVLFDGPGADPDLIAHETGHVLGLPDLYVTGLPSSFHRWDIMASAIFPRGLFAWHRWKLGWLDPAQIVCFDRGKRVQATLAPLERPGGRKAIVLRRGRYAYVAEVRQPVATPAGPCRGGVLVYRVEFGAASGTADIQLYRARPERTELRTRCGPLAEAALRRGRGAVSRARMWGLRFEVLSAFRDGSFRVRVTKPR